jgi:predicted RNase H-like HicB family nuclease
MIGLLEGQVMRYAVVIERADGNHSAQVRDSSRCAAADPPKEEVAQNMREAIRFQLDGLRHDGVPIAASTSMCEYGET